MSSSTEGLTGIDLGPTFAPFYWGFVISLFLGGITIVQAWMYFPASNDGLLVRFTAATMILFDTTSSFLVAYSLYYYLIPDFGSLVPFSSLTPQLSAECLLSTMITFNSQMYFVYQLYNVKRIGRGRWWVLGSITFFAVLTVAGSLACVTTMYKFHRGILTNRIRNFSIFFGIAKGSGAVTDILATIAMCIYLTSSRTGISQTNVLLNSLIQFVIHRGALVTLIQTLLLITFYAAPTKLYWLALHINVTKLYANTFFAMLNGRKHLKEKLAQPSVTFNAMQSSRLRKSGLAFRSEDYDLHSMEPQDNDNRKSMGMPTVTKTVVVTDM